MTGFARTEGTAAGLSWAWEARSVNGKGLDVRCRVPAGMESVDAVVRDRAGRRFRRGNITINLSVTRGPGTADVRVNTAVLERLLSATAELRRRWKIADPPDPEALLTVRGVVDVVEAVASPDVREAQEAAIIADLEAVLAALGEGRRAEGQRLEGVLADLLAAITDCVRKAGEFADRQPVRVRDGLHEQLAALNVPAGFVSDDRLAQEVAMLATKADVREELDRLAAHCEAGGDLLAVDGPIGRRFEFLCQELNREANTLCSKSVDMDLTRVGLDLKLVIDQLREQVLNIE